MKKIIILVLLYIPFIGISQSLEKKIPSNAEAVVAINGDRILELFTVEEFDNLVFSEEIFNELVRNDSSITSIEDLGFNLNSKFYGFYEMTDSINYFSLLAKLTNKDSYEKLISEYDKEKIVRANGLNILSTYSTVTIWNDHMLLTCHGEKVNRHFELNKDRYLLQADSADQDIYDIKERLETTWVENYAYAIFNNYPSKSILQNKNYLTGKGKNAVSYFWINNYGALMHQYMSAVSSIFSQNVLGMEPTKNMYGIESVWGNLYFDNDAVRATTDVEISKDWIKTYKRMYKSKIGSDFLNYFDQNNVLAYTSISMNTQAVLEEYPSIISKMYGGMLPQYQEETNVVSDLFSIILDEEAIGNVLTGNMLFILNGVSDRTVEYTTYEYDDDYNRTEVTKTKTEPIPDFTIMVGSENKKLLDKFVRLAAKYELVNHHVNYYKIKEHNDIPFALFFVIKNGIVFLTNSEKQISDIANNNTTTNAGKHKSMMRKNISVFYINGKKILQEIPESLLVGSTDMDYLNYAKENVSEISLTTSRLKGNKMHTEFKIDTPAEKGNSLKFFMHFFEGLVNIDKSNNKIYKAPIEEVIDFRDAKDAKDASKYQSSEIEDAKDASEYESTEIEEIKEASETIQESEIMEVVEDEDVVKDIPFSIVENAPVYPGCKGSNTELKKCLQKSIQKHVALNFNTGLANELGLAPGKKRVYVVFKIDKKGNIIDVRARGPHKRLEMEGIRVVKLLPQMIPGKQRGRPIGVNYTLPISLLVEGSEVKELPGEGIIEEVVEEKNEDN